jgi:hypothetical protein
VQLSDQVPDSKETDTPSIFDWRYFVVWGGLSIIAAIAEPFQTHLIRPYSVLVLYWVVIVGLSLFGGRVLRKGVERGMAGRPDWLVELVSIIVLVAVLTPAIRLVSPLIVGPQAHVNMPSAPLLALYVFSVAMPVAAFRRFRNRLRAAAQEPADAAPRLLQRLPEQVRAPVLRLSSNNHHVEVVTEAGREVIRMRLSDAIAEMEPVPGYGTHRSHWVAAAAIDGVEQEGHRTVLRLVNGDRVPVGKKYRPDLESAGIV